MQWRKPDRMRCTYNLIYIENTLYISPLLAIAFPWQKETANGLFGFIPALFLKFSCWLSSYIRSWACGENVDIFLPCKKLMFWQFLCITLEQKSQIWKEAVNGIWKKKKLQVRKRGCLCLVFQVFCFVLKCTLQTENALTTIMSKNSTVKVGCFGHFEKSNFFLKLKKIRQIWLFCFQHNGLFWWKKTTT